MQKRFSRARTLAIAVASATAASALAIPSAVAVPAGDQVVINEVYGGGGNSGAVLTHDFIELYNPTDEEIDLTGMTVEYFAASGNSGGSLTLNGSIPARGHYLINMASGSNGQVTPIADETGTAAMARSNSMTRRASRSTSSVMAAPIFLRARRPAH